MLSKIVDAGLKLDRNGRFESGCTETSMHLSTIYPVKGREKIGRNGGRGYIMKLCQIFAYNFWPVIPVKGVEVGDE